MTMYPPHLHVTLRLHNGEAIMCISVLFVALTTSKDAEDWQTVIVDAHALAQSLASTSWTSGRVCLADPESRTILNCNVNIPDRLVFHAVRHPPYRLRPMLYALVAYQFQNVALGQRLVALRKYIADKDNAMYSTTKLITVAE